VLKNAHEIVPFSSTSATRSLFKMLNGRITSAFEQAPAAVRSFDYELAIGFLASRELGFRAVVEGVNEVQERIVAAACQLCVWVVAIRYAQTVKQLLSPNGRCGSMQPAGGGGAQKKEKQ
jgi:hypothetical protein